MKLKLTGLALVAVWTSVFIAISPKSATAESCQATLNGVVNDIKTKYGVGKVKLRLVSEESNSPFRNTKKLTLGVSGGKYQSFMYDVKDRVHFSYAAKIMRRCPQISSTGTYINIPLAGGMTWDYYRFPDGSIRPRFCTNDTNVTSEWGVGYCD